MTMIHAIVIDDEYNGIRSLELMLAKYAPDVKVVATATDPYEGIGLINNYRPDVVFLDISMPGISGFELLDALVYKNFFLVFTTAHEEYGLKALKNNALDYLLKPVSAAELEQAIQKIKNRMQSRPDMSSVFGLLREVLSQPRVRIPLPTKMSTEYVEAKEILYIEGRSNSSVVNLVSGNTVKVSVTLKVYEQLLCKPHMQFIRIHNSYIINVDHATRYLKSEGGFVVIQNKKNIPVSKHKKEEFLKMITINPAP